jgi:hypothetical protein
MVKERKSRNEHALPRLFPTVAFPVLHWQTKRRGQSDAAMQRTCKPWWIIRPQCRKSASPKLTLFPLLFKNCVDSTKDSCQSLASAVDMLFP